MDMETSVKEPSIKSPAAPQKVSAMPPSTPKATSPVTAELHHFFADIEDLIRQAASLTGDELNQVKADLTARLSSAKASVDQMGGQIADQARKGALATDQYVHHQPWTAIGAGAAAGLLVGFLLARRHH
jgi:ElaB/YqjD/DUF883 family membrane-anchored ribosome-binding protein